ncbi:MAG: two-component regulator propeller domain-containing protein, partial [Candidatus Zixiibacteriota bacterium]
YECNLGPDPSNTSDDSCTLCDIENSPIPSNTIRTVKYSKNGELWVGTNFGLSRFDFGIERFVDVPLPAGIGPDIKVLEFDTRGNVWIGADNGLAFLDNLSGIAEVYKTQNSGLVSDHVQNIHYDKFTGKIYIATDAGISVISSTIGNPTSEVQELVAFPNPFVIDSPDDELEFNFNQNGIVRLYSMAGELIREMPVGQRWNGTNQGGEEVASGVYLFVLTDEEGNVGRGKILMIRK